MILAAAGVGFLVGLTGAGGGALMTPMLTILFSVPLATAISSDLVATLLMRPFGAAVHAWRGTVEWGIVAWLSAGSIPAAFAGAYVLHLLGGDTVAVERAIGVALLTGAAAMVGRRLVRLRNADRSSAHMTGSNLRHRPSPVRRPVTLAVGAAGGFMVGTTSVGTGSLMVVLLTLAYPALAARQLVATDLAQAIPLSAAAAGGAALFGHVQLTMTLAVAAGGVPGVLAGSLLSSRAPEAVLRLGVAWAVLASGLKYVGLPPLWISGGVACVAIPEAAAAIGHRRRKPATASQAGGLWRPARPAAAGLPERTSAVARGG